MARVKPPEGQNSPAQVLFFAPTPPPFAGPEILTQIILDSALTRSFALHHVRANFNKENARKGRPNLHSTLAAVRIFSHLVHDLYRSRFPLLYASLSQSRLGLLRDAMLVTLGKLAGSTVILHLQGGNFASYYRNASRLDKMVARYVVRRAHTLLVHASLLKDQFKDILPEGHRVQAVYNAVDARALLPEIHTYEDLARHRQARTFSRRILFIGHHSVNKGYYDLLACVADIARALPEAQLISAGQTIDRDPFRVYLGGKRLHLPPRERRDLILRAAPHSRSLGILSGAAKTRLLLDADLLVLPSYSEGMPMAILEAMAAGLPVVTTPVGALPEFFRDGVNGFLVRPGDRPQLASAILTLLRDSAMCERMGRANFDLARTLFTPDRLARDMSALFHEVLDDIAARAQFAQAPHPSADPTVLPTSRPGPAISPSADDLAQRNP